MSQEPKPQALGGTCQPLGNSPRQGGEGVGAGSGSHSRKPLIAQALLASERCSFPARQQRATVEAAFRD